MLHLILTAGTSACIESFDTYFVSMRSLFMLCTQTDDLSNVAAQNREVNFHNIQFK